MNAPDVVGYLASLFVLAAFCMHDMRRLRLLAIASNFAFIGYGALAGLGPVLLLHLVLLPVNLLRLAQSRSRSLAPPADHALRTRHEPWRWRRSRRRQRAQPTSRQGWVRCGDSEAARRPAVPRSRDDAA